MKSRDFMVVLKNADEVRALRPDFAALAKIDIGVGGSIVTAPGEGAVDYVCRLFAPAVGINEDPATGSIHCTLAPYWAARLGKNTLHVQQLNARGGTMCCTIAGDRVKIAGSARLYLQGTLKL
jgi:PhzF family phenazine biosynthesis protein